MKKIFLGSSFILLLMLASVSNALTLKESIDVALKNNPAVTSARKKADAADARFWQAVGNFLPTVKIDGTYGRVYSQPQIFSFDLGFGPETLALAPDATDISKTLTTTITQPIFVAGLVPGYSIARKSSDIAHEESEKSFARTSFNATQAYFNVLKAEKMLKLSVESKEMAHSHLNQVSSMLSAGVATQADVLRNEVQDLNADVALTHAKNGLELAKDAFNNALGRDLEEPVELTEEEFSEKVGQIPSYPDLLKDALQYRPEWIEYRLSKEIGEESLKAAYTGYLPTIMLQGQSGNRSVDYPAPYNTLYNYDLNSWSITGIASWTLFDGFGLQNRIREADANLDAQKANEDQVKNGIALEVRDAFLTLNSALETIDSSKKAVESAAENHKVSSLRYTSGVGTNLEVLDAQVQLTQAKINFLQSLFDIEIAKAKLNQVVGWDVVQ